jgi:prepilin-type N-terminal cleavage/methylation domain-containing protein
MARSSAGFTLLELMLVVTIMGTMAALMAPGVGEYLADTRASAATEDLVRLSRHVRARVQETGLAHLMVYDGSNAVSGGLGLVRVYEGMNNHCRQTPWPDAIGGSIADGHTAVDTVDLGSSAYNSSTTGSYPSRSDSNRAVIVLSVAGSQGAPTLAIICYEPGGTTLEGVGDGSNAGFAFTNQNTPITFSIARTVSGEARGTVREVVFPGGGNARFRF